MKANANKVNVLILDWSEIAKKWEKLNFETDYLYKSRYTQILGEHIAHFLHRLVEQNILKNNIHIIGHSLGAQTAGVIGRRFRERTGSKFKIDSIVSLDAACPNFDNSKAENGLLSRSRRKITQIMIGHREYYYSLR